MSTYKIELVLCIRIPNSKGGQASSGSGNIAISSNCRELYYVFILWDNLTPSIFKVDFKRYIISDYSQWKDKTFYTNGYRSFIWDCSLVSNYIWCEQGTRLLRTCEAENSVATYGRGEVHEFWWWLNLDVATTGVGCTWIHWELEIGSWLNGIVSYGKIDSQSSHFTNNDS